jgi:hypothetical protein
MSFLSRVFAVSSSEKESVQMRKGTLEAVNLLFTTGKDKPTHAIGRAVGLMLVQFGTATPVGVRWGQCW